MNRQTIVYISGKYSGNTEAEISVNIANARSKSIEVWEAGFTALCPHTNTFHFEKDCKCNYADYIDGDLALLQRCDCMLLLENWQESDGVKREIDFAKINGIPIFNSITEIKNYYTEKELREL